MAMESESSHRYAQCTGGNIDEGRITEFDAAEFDAAECSSIKSKQTADRERELFKLCVVR